MKKYLSTMVLALVAIAIVSFGQQITVRDNASTTAPVDEVRIFGDGYVSILGLTQIASPTALSDSIPTTANTLAVQVRTTDDASATIRLSVMTSSGVVQYKDFVMDGTAD